MAKKRYPVDEVLDIPVNGDIQNIHIRSGKAGNPVLLFVHGGPGTCDRSWVMPTQSGRLADSFTMVCWDQRMSGKSYKKKDADKDMTLDEVVEDMHCVVDYLRKRFGQDRIFIIGHSWGTILSCLYLQKYSDTIRAYVGMGQFVNGPRLEDMSYDYVYNYAKEHGDQNALKDLERIGRPVEGNYAGGLNDMMVQRNYLAKYGGSGSAKKKDDVYKTVLAPFFKSGEYSVLKDFPKYWKGMYHNGNKLWPQAVKLKFDETATKFDVPVYIFQGDYDQNAPTDIVKEWFELVEAPHKEYIAFHESAHIPLTDEPDLFAKKIKEKLLG